MGIERSELTKIPYLDVPAIGNRRVSLMPFWDGAAWRMWVPTERGLLEVKPADVLHSDYVGKGAARESDLFIPFVSFIWQRAGWPDVLPRFRAICDDFHNLATSVAKLRHAHRTRKLLRAGVAETFAATEIEYLATVARGIFDLLQEVIALIWDGRIQLNDATLEKRRKRRKLPERFASVVLKNGGPAHRTADEIADTFCLPAKLAATYASRASFFAELRGVRDKIVHGIGSSPRVASTEKGFCVVPILEPFDLFPWKKEHRFNEHAVSILPWVANVVLGTVTVCSEMMHAFAAEIIFPPEVAPGYRVYVRGENSDVVTDLLEIERGERIWWDDADVPKKEG